MPPSISIVIPAYNAAQYLDRCLAAIAESSVLPIECIIVDDGSTDETGAIGQKIATKILSTGGRHGPARARNLGAGAATGDIILFIDSDVCVHPDTVGRIADRFMLNPGLDAVFGSYDDAPGCKDLLSQYRNLLHCFVHNSGHTVATTFWTGCGAVRRKLFLEHDGFDESQVIEDVEFGMRLARAGRVLRLDAAIQVKHLKHWSFLGMLRTDVFFRAVPWTRLLLREGRWINDLNLRWNNCISVTVVFLWLIGAGVAGFGDAGALAVPVLALFLLVTSGYWTQTLRRADAAVERRVFGAGILLLALISYARGFTWVFTAVASAYALLLFRQVFLFGNRRLRQISGWIYSVYLLATSVSLFVLLMNARTFGTLAVLAAIFVGLNLPFYLFLARRVGRLEALAAIPFHCFYYFYSGISFIAAGCLHIRENYLWQSGN